MTRRHLVLAGALAVQIVALYSPGAPTDGPDLPLDKLVHVVLFASVTAAGIWAGVTWWAMVALMLGQALLSEYLQGRFIPGRGAEVGDLVADVIGIGIGLAVGARLARKPGRARSPA